MDSSPDSREERLRGQLLAALDGDAAAYAAFLRDLAAFLRAFFRRRLQQMPDEVEDLVQETLLAVHSKRHTYDRDLPLTAWLHAIARYKLIDLLRARAGRAAAQVPLDDDSEALLSETAAQAHEARRDLAVLLATLPEKQRLPIVHVWLEGLSVAQAAARTGLSESAVKVGVHRGIKTLAARIRGAR